MKKLKEPLYKNLFIYIFIWLSLIGGLYLYQSSQLDPSKSVITLHNRSGTGSGFILKSNREYSIAITNRHVCEAFGDLVIKILLPDSKESKGIIYKLYDNHDLCMVKIFEPNLIPVKLEYEYDLYDSIQSYGTPKGIPFYKSKGFLGKEIRLPYSEENKVSLHRVISMSVMKGMSGSGVFNDSGKLIGIVRGYLYDQINLGMMIPSSVLRDFINSEEL